MSQIHSHRDLIVWQKSIKLVIAVYEITKSFPKEEIYCLTSQTRRAVISIPANIAEGQGRRTSKEFETFLAHARGSLLELDTHLEVAFQLGYIDNVQHSNLKEILNEVGRLLNGLIRSISSNI